MKSSAVILAIAVMIFAGADAAAQQSAEPSVAVQLTTLQTGSLPRVVTGFGTVETTPAARQTIMAPVAAGVETVYVKPGQAVSADAPLIRLGPSPATAAAYAKAVSALRAAHDLVVRTRSLVDQHLATAQQLASAENGEADARATLAALKAEGAGSPQMLRAPADAIVTAVSASPGALVAQGAALIDMAMPNGLVLRAGVVPDQASEIRAGDAAQVTPLGWRDAVAGRVLLCGSIVDAQTGLIPVDIALPQGRFMPGQMAQTEIVTGRVSGYVLPHEAVLVDRSGSPYAVQAVDGVARKIAIKILLSAEPQEVVEGAFDTSAPVILAGNYQLRDGMKIRVAKPQQTDGK